MQRIISIAVVISLLVSLPVCAGLGNSKTVYVGGTITAIKEGTEGQCSPEENGFVFKYSSGNLRVPYDRIDDLEYGQKAGRRLGLALTVSPLFLLSKKRKHYLTLGFLDEKGVQQAAVFELGKNIIQATLRSLEVRTGRKVAYQDEEARKSATGDQKQSSERITPNASEAISLGITAFNDGSGLKVLSVQGESPASQIGLKPGDILLKIDGQPVSSLKDVESAITANSSGRILISYLVQGSWSVERELKLR